MNTVEPTKAQLPEGRDRFWWLAQAIKYSEGSGCFSPGRPQSKHYFGWDRAASAFILKDEYGGGSVLVRSLPVPAKLAEVFLLKCRQPRFNRRFLREALSTEEEVQVLSAGTEMLEVRRNKPVLLREGHHTPGLSLVSSRQGSEHLFLFHGLRISLGQYIAALSVAEIRQQLR